MPTGDTATYDTFADQTGVLRKAYYGPPGTKQPWDVILEQGWAPHFAASNVLKYLRRDKEPEGDLDKARWYWQQLNLLATRGRSTDAGLALVRLIWMLTQGEQAKLGVSIMVEA